MRITLLTADFPPREGGLSRLSTGIASALHKACCLESVLAPRLPGSQTWDERSSIPVWRYGGFWTGSFQAFPVFCGTSQFRAAITQSKSHILAVHPAFGGAYAALARRAGNRIPYSVLAYGPEFLRCLSSGHSMRRKFLNEIYSGAESVLAVSRFARDGLLQFGVSPGKVHLCPAGVDTERFRPERVEGVAREKLGVEGEGPFLLSTGGLQPHRRHSLVLDLIPSLAEEWPSIMYWISGEGPEENFLRQRIKKAGINRHVRFWKGLPEVKLPWLYQACDVFVYPAVQEGHQVDGAGLALLEAAACSAPVIAARSGGLPEAFLPGKSGLLVEPDDRSGMMDALKSLLGEKKRREDMGHAGREWVVSERGWETGLRSSGLLCQT